jgi:hypothetical protein
MMNPTFVIPTLLAPRMRDDDEKYSWMSETSLSHESVVRCIGDVMSAFAILSRTRRSSQ